MFFKKNFKVFLLISVFLFSAGSVLADTFGYQNGGFEQPFFNDGNIFGSKFYLPEYAELQSISVYIKFDNNASVKAGVYDSDYNLVATTTIVANTSGDIPADWFVFTFPENPILEVGNYWLVSWGDNTRPQEYIEIYLETGSASTTYRKPRLWAEGWNFSSPLSYSALNFAIYGTYNVEEPPPAEPTYLTMPAGFSTSTLAYAGQLFTDLSPIVFLVIGLPLAFWLIKKVILITFPIPEEQREAEEREFKKVGKIIAKKDTKALDKWTKKWLREERKAERKFNKATKKEFL